MGSSTSPGWAQAPPLPDLGPDLPQADDEPPLRASRVDQLPKPLSSPGLPTSPQRTAASMAEAYANKAGS